MSVSKTFVSPLAVALVIGGLLTACQSTDKNGKELDTPTSGSIAIAVDETFRPIIESHVDTFQKLYTRAKVRAYYGPEAEVVQRFLASDSVRDMVLSRRLTPEEEAEFKKLQIVPVTTPIALDGVAVIVHPSNPDTLLSLLQLANLCQGKFQKWKDVNPESKLGDVAVVFDNANSSTTRYVRDSVLAGQALTDKVFATNTHPELIEYVATHPGAIGLLGVNWISDGDDQRVKGFLRRVRVVGLSAKRGRQTTTDYQQPFQAYVALSKVPGQAHYPLCREWYIISREGRTGLGTGFASFVAGDKGQRIFLKSGLVPATTPVRLVQTQ